MPIPVSLLWVVSFISMFLPLFNQEKNKMSACNVLILCRHNFPTQADFIICFFFLFIVSLLSLQHVESWNAQECFSKQGREKIAHARKFSSPFVHRAQSINGWHKHWSPATPIDKSISNHAIILLKEKI